jgi:hypothetical protein
MVPRSRTLVAFGAVGAGLLLLVSSAGASRVPGARYSGKHSGSTAPYSGVTFVVTGDGKAVADVDVTAVPGHDCIIGRLYLAGTKIPIVDDRFAYRQGGVDLAGVFTAPQTATGTFQSTVGPPDPCTSIRVSWTATTTSPADTTPPQTAIDSAPPRLTNKRSVSFRFGAGEQGSSYRCRLDFAVLAACSSPYRTGALADGRHVFDVAAVDPSGNADPTPASATFTVDTVAPETTITAGPNVRAPGAVVRVWFRSSEPRSRFRCRLDGQPWRACESPARATVSLRGRHVFLVQATDRAGNPDRSPARRLFTVG